MLNANLTTQSTNPHLNNPVNILQSRQKPNPLQAGKRHLGRNMSPISSDLKSLFLQLRLASDDMLASIMEARAEGLLSMDPRQSPHLRMIITAPGGTISPPEGSFDQRFDFAASDLAKNSGYTLGTNTLSMKIGGSHRFEFTFNVSETDTLQEIQQKIADAINAWNGINIFANVTVDEVTGASVLAVEFSASFLTVPGEFSLGRDASISVSSSTGDMTSEGSCCMDRRVYNLLRFGPLALGNGLSMNKYTKELIESIIQKLRERAEQNMQNKIIQMEPLKILVGSLNSFLEAEEKLSLANRLENIIKSHKEDLQSVGIYSDDESGILQINEDVMKQAEERGDLFRFMFDGGQEGSSGFINRVRLLAEELALYPSGLIFEMEV